jgi:NAD(P)-dependent dehydrogenase (short-subunit alcohol dehydrogenase family)
MKTIIVTGSTRGIGYGLVDAFLARGCCVVVSGRTTQAVDLTLSRLGEKYPGNRMSGIPCNVVDAQQVQALWNAAQSHFGQVDIWINNAGISGDKKKIWGHSAESATSIIDTNINGAIYGAQVAVQGMLAQGFGAIYNMEGMGSDGRTHDGLSLYGTSKYALKYLTDALVLETKDTPLIVGALRPGMVITDLVTGQYVGKPEELARVKRVFNIIADTVDNVAPWLVDRILDNQKTGVRIRYTSTWKLLGRFLISPFKKRDLFSDLDLT